MPRQRKGAVRAHQKAAAAVRVELEERFDDLLFEDADFVPLITAHGARAEPFHRWFRYRQGFAPEFVRRFLTEARLPDGPVLDPFSGSGTVAIECARSGRDAIAVEVLSALAFLTSARMLGAIPDWEGLDPLRDHAQLMREATHPGHKAAVLCAAARTVDGEGRQKDGVAPDVRSLLDLMREDSGTTLSGRALVLAADARALPLAEGSIAGVLTSPPYLSRYDYTRINERIQRLHEDGGKGRQRRSQLRASRNIAASRGGTALHPVIDEISREAFERSGPARARQLASYFTDLARVLDELARVMKPKAPCWFNIAGTDHQRVYVPSDLVAAALAEERGFRVEKIIVARALRESGRSLGALTHVAPRESVLFLRRR